MTSGRRGLLAAALVGWLCALFGAPSSASAMDIFGNYAKVDDNFYIGFYCHVATGNTKAVAKLLLGLARLPTELADIKDVTLKKGDTYCAWMHTAKSKRDQLRRADDQFSPSHLVDTRSSDRVRATTAFKVRIYDTSRKLIAEKAGVCANHRECWTQKIDGKDTTAGVTGCFEPALPSGKIGSVVFAVGFRPANITETKGTAAPKSCDDRKAEFAPD